MNSRLLNWTILILLACIWGSSFILMKRGLESFTAPQVAALRMLIACIFIIPFSFKYVKREDAKDWPKFLAIGLCGNFIPAFLFTAAETKISSSLTGMLNSLTPFCTLIIGALFFRTKTKKSKIIGIVIGLSGAVGLLFPENISNLGENSSYGGLVLIATLFYGTSVNLIRKYASNYHSITTSCWAMLLTGPLGGIYLLFSNFSTTVHNPQFASSLLYVAILAIGGTAVSLMLFNLLIKNTDTLFATSVTYLIPIVAILWGIQDSEIIRPLQIVSTAIILSGMYIVNRKSSTS